MRRDWLGWNVGCFLFLGILVFGFVELFYSYTFIINFPKNLENQKLIHKTSLISRS